MSEHPYRPAPPAPRARLRFVWTSEQTDAAMWCGAALSFAATAHTHWQTVGELLIAGSLAIIGIVQGIRREEIAP